MENKSVFWFGVLVVVGVLGGILTMLRHLTSLNIPNYIDVIWMFGCFFLPIFYLLSRTAYFQFHFLINIVVTFILTVVVVLALVSVIDKAQNETVRDILTVFSIIILYAVEILFFAKKSNLFKKNISTDISDDTDTPE